MLRPRSLPAHPPVLDRDVLKAVLARGAWPRTPQALAERVVAAAGRSTGAFVSAPEAALAAAVHARLGDVPVAIPGFGRAALGRAFSERFSELVWMDPEEGRLDPGEAAVAAALDRGAKAVVLSPIAGHGAALPGAEAACRDAGAVLVVDARRSPGCRVRDRVVADFGDLTLLSVDGEPHPAALAGAILCGGGAAETPAEAGKSPLHALRESLLDEPRLRRVLALPPSSPRTPGGAGAWACTAAAVRLGQAAHRASQRARHARTLRTHCGNVVGVDLVPDPPGCQSASATFPLLATRRDAVADELRGRGVPTLGEDLGAMRPGGVLEGPSKDLADRLLLLPLLPFYRRDDIVFVGEQLRRAAHAAQP